MLWNVFGAFDLKARIYLTPAYDRSKGQALRSFSDACGNRDHVFAKHPEDFELHHIGVFDDETADYVVTPLDERFMCSAKDFVNLD